VSSVGDILSKMLPGETVLVEYSSVSSPELFLYLLHRWAGRRGTPVVIDDLVDTLPEYINRLDVMGFDVSELLKTPVIKIGGSKDVGAVQGKVEVDKYSLDFKYYDVIYKKMTPGETAFNPVVGLYRLIGPMNYHEVARITRNIASFVGRRSRVAFYFMNREHCSAVGAPVLPMLEEISTSVLLWERENGTHRLSVLKSAAPSIDGISIEVGPNEIREG